MRLHGRYHSPLSRALSQFTGALGQVGDDHGGDDQEILPYMAISIGNTSLLIMRYCAISGDFKKIR